MFGDVSYAEIQMFNKSLLERIIGSYLDNVHAVVLPSERGLHKNKCHLLMFPTLFSPLNAWIYQLHARHSQKNQVFRMASDSN
jgi:hypothetical protein